MSSVILVAKLPAEGNVVESCVNSAIKVVGARKFLHRATDNRNVVLMYTALTNDGLGQDYVDVMNKEVAVLYGKIVDYMKERRDELKLNFCSSFRIYSSLGEEDLPCNIQSELSFSDASQYDKLVQFVKGQIRGTTILFEKSKFATETEAVYAGRNWELKIHMPFANSNYRGECLGILLGLLQVHADRPVLNDLFKKAMSLRAKMRRLRAPGAAGDDGVARRIETAVERLLTHVKRLKCVRYGVQLDCCVCNIYISNPTLLESKFVKGGGLEIEDFACVSEYTVNEFEHAVLYRSDCDDKAAEECSNDVLLQDLERLENALDIAADFRREEEEDTDDD